MDDWFLCHLRLRRVPIQPTWVRGFRIGLRECVEPVFEGCVLLDICEEVFLGEGCEFWVGFRRASERCNRSVQLVLFGNEVELESV